MFESKINRGRANGYAPLDSGSKVPLSYLPPIQSTIDTGSFATTSSLNTISESIDGRVSDLEIWSSSLTETFATDLEVQIVSSSVAATIGIVSQATGLATTGSNTFFGEQTVSGSLLLAGNISGALALVDNVEIFTSQINFIPNSSGEVGSNLSTIQLVPDVNSPSADQMLIIDPTAGVPNHIHLRPGGEMDNSSTSIILGGESSNVSVVGGQNPPVQITSNNYLWQFDTDGTIIFPDYSVQTTAFTGINSSSFATTGSNSFSGSQTITGSLIVSSIAVVSGGINVPTGSTLSLTSGSNIFVDSSGGITGSFSGSVFGIGDVTAFSSSVNSRINSITSSAIPAGTISGSSQLTSSFDTRYTLSGSVQPLPNGLISGSSQLTSSFDTRYAPSASYLTSLNGTISGSSQLTASYDTRYTLSGSVVSGTASAGTISGSAQLTSSFDGRYVQTGSFNSLTASFNSFTASAQSVTTGSNSFNGTQTITGSLIITTGSFVASQILANTASLYLTSGSNMYVQNNGVVEITGSLIVSGSTMFASAGGDEGGEIQFGIPTTNTTLQNRVTVDVWRSRLRIFEGSAGANGVFIDLSKPTGNNNEITYKASGLVNAGDFVQLDNIKATITTTGNRGLSLATVSGTFVCNIAGNYAGAVVGASGSSGTATITTSASTSLFGWGFTTQGDIATYIITDTTNSRAYRITIQIGGSYLNNLVSIERLH